MGAAVDLSGEWGACPLPAGPVPAPLAAEVRQAMGMVPSWVARTAPCPWMVRAVIETLQKPVAFAPRKLCDLVTLVVSQDNSCRYCYGTQRALLRIHGYSDEYMDALVRDFQVRDLSPAERAALDFARRISRANPSPGRAEFEQVVSAGMSRLAVAEIAMVTASASFTNRMATLIALPPDRLEGIVRSPLFRFMRPLMAWRMRARARNPEPLTVPNEGFCASVVAALAGSPGARVFRGIIDAACASEILPRRAKMLMFAVIARVLGGTHVEAEARAALAEDGFGTTDVDEVLATLGSPRLDAREARLVPFARETVRYQPAVIQQRFRDVARDFSPAEILETAGTAGLANALCRLSVVLDV